MTHGYSEEELAALTDEEREAIEAEVDPDELTAVANTVDVEEETDEEPEEDPEDEPEEEPEEPEEESEEPEEEVEEEPEEEVEEEVEEEPAEEPPAQESTEERPVNPYEYSDPAKEKLRALRDQLSDGEISQAEYDEQADTVKALDYRERLQEVENAKWISAVNRFLSAEDNKEYGPKGNPVKFAALDGEVRRLANIPAEIDGLTHQQILSKAKRNVEKAFGAPEPGKPKKPKAKVDDAPNLGDVPAAAVENPRANTSEFSHLDKLNGAALEDAIEKLTPEQQERFLAGR